MIQAEYDPEKNSFLAAEWERFHREMLKFEPKVPYGPVDYHPGISALSAEEILSNADAFLAGPEDAA